MYLEMREILRIISPLFGISLNNTPNFENMKHQY